MMLDSLAVNMSLSIDQAIQIVAAVGTWLAAIGTVGAVVVALWLAHRGQKVLLNVRVGLQFILGGGVAEECLTFRVTNLGDRPVTIESIGWRVGAGKTRKDAFQPESTSRGDRCPKRLEHGEAALFFVDISEFSTWITDFSERFIADRPLRTLRAQIHTSVGYTKVVRPEPGLLQRLKENVTDI